MTIEELVTTTAFAQAQKFADELNFAIFIEDNDDNAEFAVRPKESDGKRMVEKVVWKNVDRKTKTTENIEGKIYVISPDMSIEEAKIESISPKHNVVCVPIKETIEKLKNSCETQITY